MIKGYDLQGQKFNRLLVIKRASKEDRISKNQKLSYWDCICDCGNKTQVGGSKLKRGEIRSCGCLNREANLKPRTRKGLTGLKEIYKCYIYEAKDRNLEFNLDLDQFEMITSMPCHYCGINPNRKSVPQYRKEESKANGTYFYNGIDRVDNWKGYHENNCVPACAECNRAKNNMSYNEFINLIKRQFYNCTKCNLF